MKAWITTKSASYHNRFHHNIEVSATSNLQKSEKT